MNATACDKNELNAFFDQLNAPLCRLEPGQLNATQTISQVMPNKLIPQITEHLKRVLPDDSLLGDAKNHSAFYVAAIKPIPYAITAIEQLVFNDEQ